MRRSPSTFLAAALCLRKWAYLYLGPRGPEHVTFGSALGKAIHRCLEGYPETPLGEVDLSTLDYGTLTKVQIATIAEEAPRRALVCLEYVPRPEQCVRLEKEHPVSLNPPMIGGEGVEITNKSSIDLLAVLGGGTVIVVDYKSTRGGGQPYDPWHWSLNEVALPRNVQAVIYGLAAMVECRVSEVELRWIYTLTDLRYEPRSYLVRATLSWEDAIVAVQPWWELGRLLNVIELAFADGSATVDDVPFSIAGCDAYGGCQFSGVCSANRDQSATNSRRMNHEPDRKTKDTVA